MRSASDASGYWPPDMARRSYLRRIAEPLTPGLPALFSVPRAAPDERRPPAASASASTPTLRRATASGPATSSPGRVPRASFGGGRRAVPNTPPSPSSAIAPDLTRPSTDPALEAVKTRSAAPPLALGRDLGAAPTALLADTVSIRPAAAEHTAPTHSALLGPAETPSAPAAGDAVPDADEVPADSGAVALPLRPPAAPPAGLEPASPRIHIGTVEVRTTPQALPPTAVQPPSPAVPPAASPASGNATAPLSRAYGWRYGLIQS
jgi:hypothetical protein